MVRGILIQVKDKDGRVVEERRIGLDVLERILELVNENKGDLGTDWLGWILASMFGGTSTGVRIQAENGDQSTRWFYIANKDRMLVCNVLNRIWDSCADYFNFGFIWIAIGTGVGTPQRTDTKLIAEYMRRPATATYKDGSGIVAISAQFLFSESKSITEVGLLLCPGDSSAPQSGICVLLDHTVLDRPTNVSAGQTIYIEYRLLI